MPDIEANIRIDQTWGSAQIAGGLHDNRARYYESANGFVGGGVGAGAASLAHPADKWGYAVSAGFDVNLPIAKGELILGPEPVLRRL